MTTQQAPEQPTLPGMNGPLLRARDVAQLLAISTWQVETLRREGHLVGISVGARTWRYDGQDVAEFIRRRRA